MNKYSKIIIPIVVTVVLSLSISGCGSSSTNASSTSVFSTSASSTSVAQSSQVKSDNTLKIFTLEVLKKYDGQNGNPAYVAVNGKVYDVTNVSGWVNGMHQGFKAGNDITEAIKSAPHGLSVLDKVPLVGNLAK